MQINLQDRGHPGRMAGETPAVRVEQHRETDRSAGLDNNAHALSKRPKRGIDLIDPALVQRVAEPAHRLFVRAEPAIRRGRSRYRPGWLR